MIAVESEATPLFERLKASNAAARMVTEFGDEDLTVTLLQRRGDRRGFRACSRPATAQWPFAWSDSNRMELSVQDVSGKTRVTGIRPQHGRKRTVGPKRRSEVFYVGPFSDTTGRI
ncbi:MAG: hypothetical protein OXM02_01700 [Bacteroidota bacterium]|nr:hypothetical protein [Bacteroidota bacterium]MDE2833219.1 hypothetical protein [Bacteroidota bacterium]MDE2955834.1 hypothetical protein [Bacteroidota bacterium]